MAIKYHAGKRIQGGAVNVTTSTSGTTANATNNGSGCTQVTGIIGNALDFNSGNYQIPKASINFGSEWSVNYWVNVETTSGTSNNNYHLVARGSTMDSNFRSYLSYDDPNGAPALMINCYDSTGTRISYDTSNNHMWLNLNAHAGSWAMVTFTWNNSDKKLRAYLNGTLGSTSKAWTHSSAGNMGTPTHDWGLGNNESDTATTYSAKAKFDEMSFWKCTLSDADITELYNSGSGIEATALSNTTSMSKLNTYYNFEQGSNATLTNQAPTTVIIQDTKPTDVQVGSRYEETNTRKIYYKDDVDWKELGVTPTNYRKDSWYEHLTGETP
jgi:hypothetical protein